MLKNAIGYGNTPNEIKAYIMRCDSFTASLLNKLHLKSSTSYFDKLTLCHHISPIKNVFHGLV